MMRPNTVDRPDSLEAKSPFELRVNLGRGRAGIRSSGQRSTTGDMGFLHSFTTGSAVDGPGVRVVAWTTGCHWRCRYCHNPDTWTMTNGMPVPLAKAADELRKYRHGLKVMSGGFTLSGGEPLMQDRFAVKLFTPPRRWGFTPRSRPTATSASRLTDAELEQIDLVLLGIKTWDPERHRRAHRHGHRPDARLRAPPGGPQKADLGALRAGARTDRRCQGQLRQIAKFAASLGNVERVEVLPFHQMGRFKWKELKLNYTLDNVQPPTIDAVERACAQFRSEGLNAY